MQTEPHDMLLTNRMWQRSWDIALLIRLCYLAKVMGYHTPDCVCLSIYLYIYVRIYIYTFIYTHTHIYVYIYISKQILLSCRPCRSKLIVVLKLKKNSANNLNEDWNKFFPVKSPNENAAWRAPWQQPVRPWAEDPVTSYLDSWLYGKCKIINVWWFKPSNLW